ncbi:MAG: hypothetical protein JXQ73_13925 [Phycisphaerae bacterium]|nr:hypothetical protein [Phycisphaerae bacterium]
MSDACRGDDNCIEDCLIGQALDGLMVGLVLTGKGGKVIWLNRVAEIVLGTKKREARGRPLNKVLRDPRLASFWVDAARRYETVMGEISVQWPQKYELKVNLTCCMSQAGGMIGRAMMFCDLTKERAVQVQLSQAVASRLLDLAGTPPESEGPIEGLTVQETRVLRLVGQGTGNLEIAEKLHVSASTVRSHLKNAYRKLGLSSRAEAVSYALKHLAP